MKAQNSKLGSCQAPTRSSDRIRARTAHCRPGNFYAETQQPSSGLRPVADSRHTTVDTARLGCPPGQKGHREFDLGFHRPVDNTRGPKPLCHPRARFRIGTFNVRSLIGAEQKMSLARDAERLQLDIIGIQESRIKSDDETVLPISKDGSETNSDYKFLPSCNDRANDPAATAIGNGGVGVLLSKRALGSLIEWRPVSSRICYASFDSSIHVAACTNSGSTAIVTKGNRAQKRLLTVITAYAPHDAHLPASKDGFYDTLDRTIKDIPKHHVIVLIGDFNSRIGPKDTNDCGSVGQWALQKLARTDNGQRLVDLSKRHNLVIASTFFKHNWRSTATFAPIDTKTVSKWTQLDHIAISRRWQHCITNSKSHWGLSTYSDHALLVADMTISLARPHPRHSVSSTVIPFNTAQLQVADTRLMYQESLATAINSSSVDDSRNLDEMWDKLSAAVTQTADTVLGPKPKTRKNEFYHSAATVALLSQRECTSNRSKRKEITRRFRQSVQADRGKYLNDLATKAQAAVDVGDTRKLFEITRKLTGRQRRSLPPMLRATESEQIVTSAQDKLKLLAKHFEQQFNFAPANVPVNPVTSSFAPPKRPIDDSPPNIDEIRRSISNMKSGRAAGPDGLPPELFKFGGPALEKSVQQILNAIWSSGEVPSQWTSSICTPVFKKGAMSVASNYRGINLLCTATKLLESIIASRMAAHREATTREQQAGFRRGRGCTDHVFTLRLLSELYAEFRQPMTIVFLDFKAAFDSVDRVRMWGCLERRGIPANLIKIIRSLYTNQKISVAGYGSRSEPFEPKSGVWQGGVLSPMLFTMIMDEILNEADSRVSGGVNTGDGRNDDIRITFDSLEYADDIALLDTNHTRLQERLDALALAASRYGLRFAPQKCAILPINDPPIVTSQQLKLYDSPIPIVDQFTYLGSVFNNLGKCQQDIQRRIAIASATFQAMTNLWDSPKVTRRTKANVYNACVRSIVLYGCESWTLRQQDSQALSVFDNRCLRRLTHTAWNHFRTNLFVQQLAFGERANALGNINRIIQKRQLRWLGHAARMDSARLPNSALHSSAIPVWRTRCGGRPMTWRRKMLTDTRPLYITSKGTNLIPRSDNTAAAKYAGWMSRIEALAGDRDSWNRISNNMCDGKPIVLNIDGNKVCGGDGHL